MLYTYNEHNEVFKCACTGSWSHSIKFVSQCKPESMWYGNNSPGRTSPWAASSVFIMVSFWLYPISSFLAKPKPCSALMLPFRFWIHSYIQGSMAFSISLLYCRTEIFRYKFESLQAVFNQLIQFRKRNRDIILIGTTKVTQGLGDGCKIGQGHISPKKAKSCIHLPNIHVQVYVKVTLPLFGNTYTDSIHPIYQGKHTYPRPT